MNLPQSLVNAINVALKKWPRGKLLKACEALSLSYREQSVKDSTGSSYLSEDILPAAYLALRFPGTFAAISYCLKQLPAIKLESLLDCGSGPGTLFFAAQALGMKFKETCFLEKEEGQIQLGKAIGAPPSSYVKCDFRSYLEKASEKKFDLVAAAYALSELKEGDQEGVVAAMWQKAAHVLLIVEPGTPYGFKAISKARDKLIQEGAFIVAPCTHEKGCPLVATSEWCHFATRFDRPPFLRDVKDATLGFEDEKFSYLIASKSSYPTPESRLIKSPEKHSGHVQLTLCNERGVEKVTLSKKLGELYRQARKLEWGDKR